MPSESATGNSSAIAGRDVLLIAASCVGALELFYFAFGQLVASRIGEPWTTAYPFGGVIGPFAAIAFSSGFVVGALVGAFVPVRGLRVAVWAAVVACLLSFGSAIVAGGLTWVAREPTVLLGPLLGVGLVCGALLLRKVRHV